MGADMTLACAPACDLMPQRVKQIQQVVQAIPETDEDFRELMESLGYDDPAQAKNQIMRCSVESQEEGREVTTLHLPGCPYPVHVSGGLSWGDPPTESYTVLEHVARCPQLWQVLEVRPSGRRRRGAETHQYTHRRGRVAKRPRRHDE